MNTPHSSVQPIRPKPRTNDQTLNIATRIYNLSKGDIERFDCLYRTGPRGRSFRNSFISQARTWRRSWRSEFKTNARCRRHYLAQVLAQDDPLTLQTPMREFPSMARYLCWRVEAEVRRMDAKQS